MDVCEEYGIASTWEILTEEMLQFLVSKHFKVWIKMRDLEIGNFKVDQ